MLIDNINFIIMASEAQTVTDTTVSPPPFPMCASEKVASKEVDDVANPDST